MTHRTPGERTAAPWRIGHEHESSIDMGVRGAAALPCGGFCPAPQPDQLAFRSPAVLAVLQFVLWGQMVLVGLLRRPRDVGHRNACPGGVDAPIRRAGESVAGRALIHRCPGFGNGGRSLLVADLDAWLHMVGIAA